MTMTSHMSADDKPPAVLARSLPQFTCRVRDLVDTSAKTQRQIALELGYDRPNIISMFKQGSCRVPVDKVGALASVLGDDPVELLRLWLRDYEPELLAVIEGNLGLLLSVREREWIEGLRGRFPEGLPPWEEVAQR